MLKLGITTLAGLARGRSWLGRERHASFLLLEPLARRHDVDPSAYDTLVARVRLPNGTWKQTASARLRLVDEALVTALRTVQRTGTRLSVLDLGASTGITTVELHDALRTLWDVRCTATDLYRDVFAVGRPDRGWALIVDRGGRPLQHVLGRFVLPGQLDEAWIYPVNRVLKRWSTRVLLPRAADALRELRTRSVDDFATIEVGGLRLQRLPLLAGRCLERLRSDPGFAFVEHDILQPLERSAMVVRAMNLLTHDAFEPAVLPIAVANAVAAVEPGGWLVIGQSRGLDPRAVDATIFRLTGDGAAIVTRLGSGADIEPLVVATVRDARRRPVRAGSLS